MIRHFRSHKSQLVERRSQGSFKLLIIRQVPQFSNTDRYRQHHSPSLQTESIRGSRAQRISDESHSWKETNPKWLVEVHMSPSKLAGRPIQAHVRPKLLQINSNSVTYISVPKVPHATLKRDILSSHRGHVCTFVLKIGLVFFEDRFVVSKMFVLTWNKVKCLNCHLARLSESTGWTFYIEKQRLCCKTFTELVGHTFRFYFINRYGSDSKLIAWIGHLTTTVLSGGRTE